MQCLRTANPGMVCAPNSDSKANLSGPRAIPIRLIRKRGHPDTVILHLRPLLPPRNTEYHHSPQDPHRPSNDGICHYNACLLPGESETEKSINQTRSDKSATQPDVSRGVWGGLLVALVLDVVDVAEDGLEDEEDYDHYPEDRVEVAHLELKGQLAYQRGKPCYSGLLEGRGSTHTPTPGFIAMYTPNPSPIIAPR